MKVLVPDGNAPRPSEFPPGREFSTRIRQIRDKLSVHRIPEGRSQGLVARGGGTREAPIATFSMPTRPRPLSHGIWRHKSERSPEPTRNWCRPAQAAPIDTPSLTRIFGRNSRVSRGLPFRFRDGIQSTPLPNRTVRAKVWPGRRAIALVPHLSRLEGSGGSIPSPSAQGPV
jgi:hypothetical protein